MDTSPVLSDSLSIIQVIRKPLSTKNVRTPRPSGKNGTCKWWQITRSTATARSPSRDGIVFWLRLVLSLEFRTEACASLSAMTKWDDSPHRWRNDCPRGDWPDSGRKATRIPLIQKGSIAARTRFCHRYKIFRTSNLRGIPHPLDKSQCVASPECGASPKEQRESAC